MSHCSTQSGRGAYVGHVVANRRVCDAHYLLRLAFDKFPATRPGQFVQLQCRGLTAQVTAREVDWPAGGWPRLAQAELVDKEPLLRRPLSLAGRTEGPDGPQLDIIYRAIGTGTHWLTSVREGVALSVLGPLGNAFPISPAKKNAALIGGGVGIPPMIYLAEALGAAGKNAVAFSGIRSVRLLPLTVAKDVAACREGRPGLCVQEFARYGVRSVIATDDGSMGFAGPVGKAFANWLDAGGPAADDLVVYSCGPEAMMRAVADLCIARGIECHLALERHMACGVGTCQSCVVKIRSDNDRGWEFKLCCTHGPVFDARSVLW